MKINKTHKLLGIILILAIAAFLYVLSQLLLSGKIFYRQNSHKNTGQKTTIFDLQNPNQLRDFNKIIGDTSLQIKAIDSGINSQEHPLDFEIYKDDTLIKEFDFHPSCASYDSNQKRTVLIIDEKIDGESYKDVYVNAELYEAHSHSSVVWCPQFSSKNIYILSTNEDFTSCQLTENKQVIKEFYCRSNNSPELYITNETWMLTREINPFLSSIFSLRRGGFMITESNKIN